MIWTWATVSISKNENYYTTGTSNKYVRTWVCILDIKECPEKIGGSRQILIDDKI